LSLELIDFQSANEIDNTEIFALSGRLQDLARQKRKGQITDEGAGVKQNNIVDALLKLIDEIKV
jgi:Effector-associated domain 11